MTIIDAMKERTSVRTYDGRALTKADADAMKAFIKTLDLKKGMRFRLINLNDADAGEVKNLSAYGIIKGAKTYVVGMIKKGTSMQDFGYAMEQIVLYATQNGMGTCWLGGTFKRSVISKLVALKDGWLIPIISPFGYAANKPSNLERIMRLAARSDTRKSWDTLFLDGKTGLPLSETTKDEYGDALDMMRLAPSASNKQPWRVVKTPQGDYDFYILRDKNYGSVLGYDIQLNDMGIALCHFVLTARVQNKAGELKASGANKANKITNPSFEYITTFVRR